MNNEELKKKIIEILEETEYEWTEQKNGYILQIFYDKLADALIAAGIGDTTNLIVENKVLQRALLTTCVKLIEDEVDNVNAELLARVVYTKALRKARKEVEEEKNEQV